MRYVVPLALALLASFVAPAPPSAAAADLAGALPPADPPLPRPAPERPRSMIQPYLGTPAMVPAPRLAIGTCPQMIGGIAGALGQPDGATYGSAYGENLGGGPGSINAQASAVLGMPCPPALIGGQPVPGTLDLSGAPHAATPYQAP